VSPLVAGGNLVSMQAMLVEAEWAPRGEVAPEPGAAERRLARNGNLVWRRPRFRVTDLPEPPVAPDEVLIRVRACGICGSDVHLYERDAEEYMLYPGLVTTPVVTGHEFSGVVERVGSAVVDFQPGDPVCAEEIAWCGACLACKSGQFNYCSRLEELGFTFNGAHAELVVTRARSCWPIHSLVRRFGAERGFLAAALVEPTSVAYLGMFVQASFRPGQTVAVIGGGPIGLAAVGLGRAAGAGRVVLFEPSATRRQLAEALGTDATFDPRDLGPDGVVRAESEDRGFDLWVEASGAPGVIDTATRALAPTGTVALIGLGPHRADIDPVTLIRTGSGLRGSLGHSGHGAFGNVIRLMAAGRLDMSRIVTRTVGLAQAVGCLEDLRDREAGKCMVVF
jgi:scyllo-inosose 3-dehydrogenase